MLVCRKSAFILKGTFSYWEQKVGNQQLVKCDDCLGRQGPFTAWLIVHRGVFRGPADRMDGFLAGLYCPASQRGPKAPWVFVPVQVLTPALLGIQQSPLEALMSATDLISTLTYEPSLSVTNCISSLSSILTWKMAQSSSAYLWISVAVFL